MKELRARWAERRLNPVWHWVLCKTDPIRWHLWRRRDLQRRESGSTVEVIVGAVPATSAPRAELVHLDEIEQMDPEIFFGSLD
jgi:hypothetical protein